MLKIFFIFIISLIFLSSVYAENIEVFEFTEKELAELEIRKVRGADNNTTYTVGSNENGNFLISLKMELKILILLYQNLTIFHHIHSKWPNVYNLPFEVYSNH